MKARELLRGVHWVGVNDWDRQIFDALVPLPEGTSYNAYVVQGSEKTVLIDSVEPQFYDQLDERLSSLGLEKLDYIIANHAEQDHSGSIPDVLERFPEAKVVCTSMCKKFLIGHLDLPEEVFQVVKGGDTLSLGDRTLEFIHFPWVHWPETMITYLREDKVLFPCDFYGVHLATNDVFFSDKHKLRDLAKLYYAEIMMPFTNIITKNLGRIEGYEFSMICPSHGPVHTDTKWIMDLYADWITGPPRNKAVIAYATMHESTRIMVEHFTEALTDRGVRVEIHNMEAGDTGKLASSLVDAGTIILASPTTLSGPHPTVAYAAYLANVLRPKAPYAAVIGSYGWGGTMVEQLAQLMPNLKLEYLEPVLAQGMPRDADFAKLDALAETIAQKHKDFKKPE